MTKRICFHGFASLSTERGESVDSPEFEGLGNQWSLAIYPGGDTNADEGMVSIYLNNMSDKSLEIDFDFSVNGENGNQMAYEPVGDDDDDMTASDYFKPFGGMGYNNFASRSNLLNFLVDGALVVKVNMNVASLRSFIPENPPACKTIQCAFLNNKYADIVFKVGVGKGKEYKRKKSKSVPITFPAHRVIVANSSSIFADLCESTGDGTTPIQITGVSPAVFRLLLSYIYSVKIPEDDMKSYAKEIIDAADKFGVTRLKLEAEASIVDNTNITMENVMELLLYADSKNCALLKEAAIDYIVENKADVIEKNLLSFVEAPGTLVRDVLATVLRGEREDGIVAGCAGDYYSSMRISKLRKKAHEKGLDVDGSREMLIAALKKANELESKGDSDEDTEESNEEPDDL
jgi:hypothetical protein